MGEENVQEDDIHVMHGPYAGESLPKETLGRDLHTSLLNTPKDSVVMIDAFTHEKLLHWQLFQKSVNLAAALRSHGYHGQDTVLALSSENSLNFFVPVLASLFNGSITAPLNHSYTPYELEHTLSISTPRIVFCSGTVAQKFIDLKVQKLSYIEKIIILDNGPLDPKYNVPGLVYSMDDFIQGVLKGRNVDVKNFQPVDGDTSKMAALIMCSSGTTGLPKGVTLSHLNMICRTVHSRDPKYFAKFENENLLGLMPFFHGFGMCVSLSAIANRSTIICFSRFDEDVFLQAIQDYKIGTLALAPPLAVFLAKSKKVANYDLSSVTNIYCGAAPLSKETEQEVISRIKAPMRQGYGLTEATLAVLLHDINNIKTGSSGKIISYMSCKVRDPETGRSLGPNQTGELCWKGPLVMLGYYRNEQATRDTFTSDGFLKSGDLGYYDEDGFFYVIDRLKELIKYKGYQVAPAELEAIILNHCKVADVGVVGLPDELVGERPLAFVVKRQDSDVTEEDIKKHVAEIVSPQKRLSGGVIFVKSIPKNPSGKILRRELREMLKKYNKATLESKL